MIQRVLVSLVLLAAPALAQIGPEPVFTGNASEPFAGPNFGFLPCVPQRAFNNRADFCTPLGSGAHLTQGWGFYCSISPRSSPYLYGSSTGPTEISFDQPVTRFGGYFGSNASMGDATFEFFDVNGASLGSLYETFPNDCQWRWFGFRVFAGAPISSIVVTGNHGSGGYVLMDDLEADFPAASPVTYCTSGVSTNGCMASISASANPSVSAANACVVNVSSLEGQRNGSIFYGLHALPQLWCFTTGTSFLCVQTPTYRAPAQSSGGSNGLCDGSMALDWDAFMQANPLALGQPWAVGSQAFVQCWYRDPGRCRFSSMSDAVELTYLP